MTKRGVEIRDKIMALDSLDLEKENEIRMEIEDDSELDSQEKMNLSIMLGMKTKQLAEQYMTEQNKKLREIVK